MKRDRQTNHGHGVTLIEVLVTMALFTLAAGLGYPALQQMIHRGKIEGFTRNSILIIRETRLEAVKRGVPCIFRVDNDLGAVVAYADVNRDGLFNPDPAVEDFRSTDYRLRQLLLPLGVSFDAPAPHDAVEGFTVIADLPGKFAVFREDGSIGDVGAFRIGDERGNFLEVRVAPAATAKVTIRKWDGEDWRLQGEEGETWQWQ